MSTKAVFLDRDGTIIEDRGYIRDPSDVALLPGAGDAIRRLADAGHLIVVVSNQSGVARGIFDQATLDVVHKRMEELLREHHAPLHGVYYCPFLDGPEAVVADYRKKSDMRKPEPGMLRKAATELDIDLTRSWMIGDSATDVEAGATAGCGTILIQKNGVVSPSRVAPTHRVTSLSEAAELLESKTKPATAARKTADPVPARNPDRTVELLEQILKQLQRDERSGRQADFSVLRLIGALLQMFAVVAGVWGVIALIENANSDAFIRILLAIFLQIASLSARIIDRFR